jgi:hypothetical protein
MPKAFNKLCLRGDAEARIIFWDELKSAALRSNLQEFLKAH